MQARSGTAVEVSFGGAYAVQVASQRSAAEARASFRALRAKFPNQLGGREPIVRRTDLGAKGIYYRAMVGPFASMEKAAGMCRALKAAGCNCFVAVEVSAERSGRAIIASQVINGKRVQVERRRPFAVSIG
jgi:cell division septation protein DedD